MNRRNKRFTSDIPTLEQEETDEKIKTEWLTNFNRLLNETQGYLETKK